MKKSKVKPSKAHSEAKVRRRETEEPPTKPPSIFNTLPTEVCHLILSRMPIRDAVRTSVLSKAWREKWRAVTGIIFDESCLPPLRGSGETPAWSYHAQLAGKHLKLGVGGRMYTRGVSKAVNRWLMQRSEVLLLDQIAAEDIVISVMERLLPESNMIRGITPLQMLRLSLPRLPVPKGLIQKLYDSDIRELVLDCRILHLPAGLGGSRQGFRQLAVLTLKGIVITAFELGGLISSCPSLSRLTLDIENAECVPGTPSTTLVMSAPHLKHLEMRLGGLVWCIRLVAPELVSAWISLHMFNGVRIHRPLPDGGCNLIHLLGQSPHLEKLTITSLSLQFLCAGAIPFRLQQPLNQLERLEINVNFDSPFHANTSLCLFRSSPRLKRLDIYNWSPSRVITGLANQQITANIWDTAGESCSFPRLEHLVINGLNGIDSEMAFMRFVLLNAPVLAVLDIKKPSISESPLQDLLALRRERTRVTIHEA